MPGSKSSPAVPPAELWTSPMSWGGSPLRGIENFSRDFPGAAVFVRGELIYTLSEEIGPGMTRQTEKALPCLIRLDRAKPVDVHTVGLDGQCWTYRAEKRGRKVHWTLSIGNAFPSTDPAEEHVLKQVAVSRVVVQSILPEAGSRKPIAFAIRDDGSMEDFAKAIDDDPND